MTHAAMPTNDILAALRRASLARQIEWSDGAREPLPVLFKATELGGEAGEVLNVVKKLERERLGWTGSRASVEQLADELADLVICADLLAEPYAIDLGSAIVRKFNATSEQRGLATRMDQTEPVDMLADLVCRFAAALLDKLRAANAKYGHGDAWGRPDWRDDLCRQLAEHVAKGDPRDVAAYAAFAWHHGWSVSGAAALAPAGGTAGDASWGWRRASDAPAVGGLYLFGGYVTASPLPRHFERGFVTMIRTVDGPEWTIHDPQYQHIPIEWWTEAGGPHPEHVAVFPSPPAEALADVQAKTDARRAAPAAGVSAPLSKRAHDLISALIDEVVDDCASEREEQSAATVVARQYLDDYVAGLERKLAARDRGPADPRAGAVTGRSVDEDTPRKGQILAWCDHEADPYTDGETPDGRTRLTLYAAHAEGLSHAPTGFHIVEWGGSFADSPDDGGANLPDWWFVVGSEFEVAANLVLWWPLPDRDVVVPDCSSAALASRLRMRIEATAEQGGDSITINHRLARDVVRALDPADRARIAAEDRARVAEGGEA